MRTLLELCDFRVSGRIHTNAPTHNILPHVENQSGRSVGLNPPPGESPGAHWYATKSAQVCSGRMLPLDPTLPRPDLHSSLPHHHPILQAMPPPTTSCTDLPAPAGVCG